MRQRNERKLFFGAVIPAILSFALSGVYTVVDGFFIGQSLGDMGLAAVTLGYPVCALVGAIGTGIGLAGAIRFTILGAQGEEERGRECFSGTAVYLLLQGVGDGSQPIISRCYGEGDRAAVRDTRRLAYGTSGVITVLCMAGIFLARGKVGVLFGASAEANGEVVRYLPYFLATLLFLSFARVTTSYFYATEKTALSYLLVYAEPAGVLLFLLALPPVLGLQGVWLAVPLAQVVTFGIAVVAKGFVDRERFSGMA